jgi:hypothetical protein
MAEAIRNDKPFILLSQRTSLELLSQRTSLADPGLYFSNSTVFTGKSQCASRIVKRRCSSRS